MGCGKKAAPANKDKPFENSLGMKFMPVPITAGPSKGRNVLFSVWETRRKDYAVYATQNDRVSGEWKDVTFRDQPVGQGGDAVNFCEWLTKDERASGVIGPGDTYRLPTDTEWSFAVGIGEREDADKTPKEKDDRIQDVFPWGTGWPPTDSGNYMDNAFDAKFSGWEVIEGYDDGYATTAPVGSDRANEYGLHDLGGNVHEWCLDRFESGEPPRVLRGGSWGVASRSLLKSSFRRHGGPDFRYDCDTCGFRCVLVLSGS
jgi:formylglycine-generating enzyme required for sulfatase activity